MDEKPLNSVIALKKAVKLQILDEEDHSILAMPHGAFSVKRVSIAREVSTSAVVETGQKAGRTGVKS